MPIFDKEMFIYTMNDLENHYNGVKKLNPAQLGITENQMLIFIKHFAGDLTEGEKIILKRCCIKSVKYHLDILESLQKVVKESTNKMLLDLEVKI
ncbi:MAG: hypothetical protein M0P71_16165 [Melioribacteraceae bacterium]|jgi:hypothetical protein|nr:hypothetical protein [Melioribacteraceae bacterium]